ncbi:MAG: SgcJ/EcaC family oxidoreductase [Actinomycetota bacterium]|nr:SgcJ/EcaC family oxidoreductase [Actinomycetota bacterium]
MSRDKWKETTANSADEAAVRGLYQQLMDGWNQGSGAAFAAVFTEDGALVAFDGTHFKGREEIAPFHQELFDKWLKGSRLVGKVKDVRFLSPDVALMHAVGSTVMRGKSEPSPERDSIQTLVAVREGGGDEWRLAAFQNTRVRPMGPNPVAFVLWALTDLLWKVFRPNKRTTHE